MIWNGCWALLWPSPSLVGGQPAGHPYPRSHRARRPRSPEGVETEPTSARAPASPARSSPHRPRQQQRVRVRHSVNHLPSPVPSGLVGRLLWAALGGLLSRDKVSTNPHPHPHNHNNCRHAVQEASHTQGPAWAALVRTALQYVHCRDQLTEIQREERPSPRP